MIKKQFTENETGKQNLKDFIFGDSSDDVDSKLHCNP